MSPALCSCGAALVPYVMPTGTAVLVCATTLARYLALYGGRRP